MRQLPPPPPRCMLSGSRRLLGAGGWGALTAAAAACSSASACRGRSGQQHHSPPAAASAHMLFGRSIAGMPSRTSGSDAARRAEGPVHGAAALPRAHFSRPGPPHSALLSSLGAGGAAAPSASASSQARDSGGDSDGASPSPSPSPFISSPSNPYVKHCVKLRSSSQYRGQMGRMLLVGSELLREAVGAMGSLPTRVVLVREDLVLQAAAASSSGRGAGPAVSSPGQGPDRQAPSPSTPSQQRGPPTRGPAAEVVSGLVPGLVPLSTVVVSEAVMKKVTGLLNVDSIDLVAELDLPPALELSNAGLQVQRLLALDRVQDPGNLGTLIRTATAFGWDGVFLLQGCADPFGDKAIRASRGAALRFPICRGDLTALQSAAATQGLRLLAAEPDETLCPTSKGQGQGGPQPPAPELPGVCLVLGSEGQGLDPEVLACCTPVSIPMSGGRMESLNVGIAGGILMFMLSGGGPLLTQRLEQLGRSGR